MTVQDILVPPLTFPLFSDTNVPLNVSAVKPHFTSKTVSKFRNISSLHSVTFRPEKFWIKCVECSGWAHSECTNVGKGCLNSTIEKKQVKVQNIEYTVEEHILDSVAESYITGPEKCISRNDEISYHNLEKHWYTDGIHHYENPAFLYDPNNGLQYVALQYLRFTGIQLCPKLSPTRRLGQDFRALSSPLMHRCCLRNQLALEVEPSIYPTTTHNNEYTIPLNLGVMLLVQNGKTRPLKSNS
ncbi:hypothetical protein GQR58_022535 [Nymphon striatum]|nr:hypothetical protein GQR58_022535 [Nymphon striatum]